MTGSARVGIGIPVYNGVNYLRETLEAIQRQTFDDFEVLISDNSSTDETQEIIREFCSSDDRMRYQVHPENIGAHRNYNSLVSPLQNQYFKWAAHDDVIAPEFLEKCVARLDATPSAVLAFAATQRIDEDGNVLQTLRSTQSYESESPSARLRAYIGDRLKAPQIFGVMRRSVLGESALLRNYHGSDFTLLQELAMRGRFSYIDEPLFSFRQHIEQHSAGSRAETASFFNPDRSAPLMSHWGSLAGLFDSISRVPMSREERLKCIVFAAYWASQHLRGLVGDVGDLTRYHAGRVFTARRR